MDLPQHPTTPAGAWFGPNLTPADVRRLAAELGATNGVAVLAWPRDTELVDVLDHLGIPRLLLRSPGAPAPERHPLQDWVDIDPTTAELHRRTVPLARSGAVRRLQLGAPVVVADEIRLGRFHTHLPDRLRPLAALLVDSFRTPVPVRRLAGVLHPSEASCLRARLAALCEHVHPLGFEVVHGAPDSYVLQRCWSVEAWAADEPGPTRTTRLVAVK